MFYEQVKIGKRSKTYKNHDFFLWNTLSHNSYIVIWTLSSWEALWMFYIAWKDEDFPNLEMMLKWQGVVATTGGKQVTYVVFFFLFLFFFFFRFLTWFFQTWFRRSDVIQTWSSNQTWHNADVICSLELQQQPLLIYNGIS